MANYQHYLFGIAIITLLAGCTAAPAAPAPAASATPAQPASPTSAAVAPRDQRRPTQSAQLSPAARAAADRAAADLAQQLGIAQATIEVLGVQPRYGAATSSDSPGPPDGWNIRLGVGDDVYLYQVDARGVLKRSPAQR